MTEALVSGNTPDRIENGRPKNAHEVVENGRFRPKARKWAEIFERKGSNGAWHAAVSKRGDEGTCEQRQHHGYDLQTVGHGRQNCGASENEMMTAMAMAQALMRRHHLSQRLSQGPRRRASTSVELSRMGPDGATIGELIRVHFWHLADILSALTNVRFGGKNGHNSNATLCPRMTQADFENINGGPTGIFPPSRIRVHT